MLACLVFVLPAVSFAQTPGSDTAGAPLVVTTGRGVVQAVPDRAWIIVSAESRAPSPREVQRRNADAMRPVLDRLRAAGVPADAVRTVSYDVQYEWDFVNEKRVGRGYVARNTVEIRVDAVEAVGDLLEAAAASGATSLGGVRFDFKDRSRLEREALRLAVADARARADAAASGAGHTVDRVLRIVEQGAQTPGPQPMPMARQVEAFASGTPPVSAGLSEIEANVSLTAVLR